MLSIFKLSFNMSSLKEGLRWFLWKIVVNKEPGRIFLYIVCFDSETLWSRFYSGPMSLKLCNK